MAKTDTDIDRLIQYRHQLHAMAELSGREQETARKVHEILQDCSPDEIRKGVGGAGLIATFDGDQEGPSVMIRCELDALPIPEENELEYGSQTKGVAHKCGHDGHMAIVLGAARHLKDHKPDKGRVHLLFQPAEETGQGAERMLEDEQFQDVEPDYIFALHNLPGYPLHQVVVRDGIFASASRGYEVKLKGETSHAAHPEEGRSPAMALAALIQNFSTFPQYFSSLDEAAKVTVIHSKLGEVAFGTSPGVAEFRATMRTYRDELMNTFCDKAEQLVKDIAHTYNLECSTRWTELFKATQSDAECNQIIRRAASNSGYEVHQKETPFAWSEDFGRFTSRYKGAIFGVGGGENHPQLHSSVYDFPDELIVTGSGMFIEILNQITGFKS